MRVKIPNYHSAFHRGARVGTVIATGDLVGLGETKTGKVKIARVLLDGERGKTILVDLNDCIELIDKESRHAG